MSIAGILIRSAFITQKKCTNCFKIKPKEEFYSRKCADGYQSRCKACNTEVVAGYLKRKKEKSFSKALR